MEHETIGTIIGRLRSTRNITQEELAKAIGVSRESVKFWESGERHIKDCDLIKVAKYFGVTADYLLGLEEFEQKSEKAEADEIYNSFMALMANEVDESDRDRVLRAMTHLLAGFTDAIHTDMKCYALYEEAALSSLTALAGVSKAVRLAAETGKAGKDSAEQFLDIIDDAAAMMYQVTGHYIEASKATVIDSLGSNIMRYRRGALLLGNLDTLQKELPKRSRRKRKEM